MPEEKTTRVPVQSVVVGYPKKGGDERAVPVLSQGVKEQPVSGEVACKDWLVSKV